MYTLPTHALATRVRTNGQGQFGTVYEAHSKTGEAGPRMAAKVVWKAKLEDPVLDSVDLISEISVMMQVHTHQISLPTLPVAPLCARIPPLRVRQPCGDMCG